MPLSHFLLAKEKTMSINHSKLHILDGINNFELLILNSIMVPRKRLELLHREATASKTVVSTNSTTWAIIELSENSYQLSEMK